MLRNLLPLALLSVVVPAASAGPLSVTLDSLGAGTDVTIQVVSGGQTKLHTLDTFAGVFNMTLNHQSFVTFCIDTAHDVHVAQTYSVQQTPVETGLRYGPQMEYLYTKYVGAAVHDNQTAAALQIALWDLADGGQSLLTGSLFRYTDTHSPIYTLATEFIAVAEAYIPPDSGSVGFWQDASPSGNALGRGQSLIGPPAPGFATNVLETPAPPGIVVAISALFTLGAANLARRRFAVA